MTRSLALVCALLLPTAAHALEYRVLTLNDGRVLDVELTNTLPAGMAITVPQGETEIPFTLLVDMVPSDPTQYLSQEDWTIFVVAPDAQAPRLRAAFDAIPGIQVHGVNGAKTAFDDEQLAFAAECGSDIDCLVAAAAGAPWTWLVVAKPGETEGTFEIESRLNTGNTRYSGQYVATDVGDLQQATYDALGLRAVGEMTPLSGPLFASGDPDGKPIKPPKDPKDPKGPPPSGGNSSEVVAGSFVPLPGYPSLKAGDGAGFGMALGSVAVGTGIWVAASGHSSTHPAQHIAMGIGGFYAMTVVANQAFGLRSAAADDVMVVAPVYDPQSNATGLTVSIPLK